MIRYQKTGISYESKLRGVNCSLNHYLISVCVLQVWFVKKQSG